MSNLIRGGQDYLFNTIGPKDFGMYYEGNVTTGIKHLVCKKYGIDIPFNGKTSIIKKTSAVGTAAVITLTPAFVAKTTGDQRLFEIEVTRQPLYDGSGNHQFPVSHTYSYKLTNTATLTADKQSVVDGLVDAINADVMRTSNAVNSGACVVATRTGAAGTSALVLTAKEKGQPVTVRIFDDNFTQVLTTAPKKDTLTNDQLSRIFMIKEENAGQRVVMPTEGVDYCCFTIVAKTEGYENVSASAFADREQVYNFYMPLALVDDNLFAAIAVANAGVVPSMADVVAAPDTAFNGYVALNVNPLDSLTARVVALETAP
jgi:hypothetical protein